MGHLLDYCTALWKKEYGGNLSSLTRESTEMIFSLIKKPNRYDISFEKDIKVGYFYMIYYDFNGNHLWCPLFVIDDRYRTDLQKRLIYAINLDYLPYDYRLIFFDKLFDGFRSIVEWNENKLDNEIDKPFKVNFELMYKMLRDNGGYNYAISAYDFSKIVSSPNSIFRVSTGFVHRLLFIDTKLVNMRIMKDRLLMMGDSGIKAKLENLLRLFEEIKDDLDPMDQKSYYKRLKSLENKYDLLKK
jgi:hypothetical protein